MASFTTPIAFHFGAVFLNVPKLSTRIALLLVCVVAVAGQVAGLATVVAALLPLPLGLLAVLRNVATSTAVIAGILLKVTVLGKMARLTTAVTDIRQRRRHELEASATAPHPTATAHPGGALPGPVASTATLETLVAAHGCRSPVCGPVLRRQRDRRGRASERS